MQENQLLWLWGKTSKNKSKANFYHPLLFHLLDVGYCADLLWDKCLSDHLKQRIASALGLDMKQTRQLVALLAAVHDLGKACPGFQYQTFNKPGPEYLRDENHLRQLLPNTLSDKELHSFISAKALRDILASKAWQWQADSTAAKVLAHITGAHHGTFPQSTQLVNYSDDIVMGGKAWSDARQQLLNMVWNTFIGDATDITLECGEITDPAVVPVLAGLISVADWLGSSKFFKAETSEHHVIPLANYIGISQSNARQALETFGWLPTWKPATSRPSFRQIFRFRRINALQREVVALSESMNGPFLLIAEAPMGGGKTEAALWSCDVALCNRVANGFYLALPTQATSTAMHQRLQENYFDWREHTLNVELQLAHSNAILREKNNVELAPIDDDTKGNEAARVAAESWFSGGKESLLAPFGVGTIDQSLLGALQTPHFFVRLFGLAGKVVIFDEVHAYDTYMSSLLERLIAWLRELDCSVILLSATLPKSKRHALLQAWGGKPPVEEKKYPRLTWITTEEATEPKSIALTDTTSAKTILLDFQPTDIPTLIANLRSKLAGGGCAAVICNTVYRAQEVFLALTQNKELEDLVPKEEFHLLHARMPFAWRQSREKNILKKFGKNKKDRPRCAIVIATQVAEQSLDLDFDYMASEMAPVDLLLQRLGRLHRHEKDENGQAVERYGLAAEFTVLCDAERMGNPPADFGAYETNEKRQRVYERYVLLRSWLVLRRESTIKIPGDIEDFINQVYDTAEPTDLDRTWQEALSTARAAMNKNENNSFADAERARIEEPKNFRRIVDSPPDFTLLDDEDPRNGENVRAATRNGRPSIRVVCLCEHEGRSYLPLLEDDVLKLGATVNLESKPNLKQVKALMEMSLPISLASLFHVLVKDDPPEKWREDSHLRYYRILKFRNGKTRCGANELELSALLGLRIGGSEKEAE